MKGFPKPNITNAVSRVDSGIGKDKDKELAPPGDGRVNKEKDQASKKPPSSATLKRRQPVVAKEPAGSKPLPAVQKPPVVKKAASTASLQLQAAKKTVPSVKKHASSVNVGGSSKLESKVEVKQTAPTLVPNSLKAQNEKLKEENAKLKKQIEELTRQMTHMSVANSNASNNVDLQHNATPDLHIQNVQPETATEIAEDLEEEPPKTEVEEKEEVAGCVEEETGVTDQKYEADFEDQTVENNESAGAESLAVESSTEPVALDEQDNLTNEVGDEEAPIGSRSAKKSNSRKGRKKSVAKETISAVPVLVSDEGLSSLSTAAEAAESETVAAGRSLRARKAKN